MIDLKPLTAECPFYKKVKTTFITPEKYGELIERTKLIQEVFPPEYFDSSYREFCKSGICSECWNTTFGGEEDFEPSESYEVLDGENTDELETKIRKMYEAAERNK